MKEMGKYRPSLSAIHNSTWSVAWNALFAPVIVLEKATWGIINRSAFLQKRIEYGDYKRSIKYVNELAKTWTNETFTDPNHYRAVETAKIWAEKVGANTAAEKAYAEKMHLWYANYEEYFKHIDVKAWDGSGTHFPGTNIKRMQNSIRQMEIGISDEVKDIYAKKSWMAARKTAKSLSMGIRDEKILAYRYYDEFIRLDKYRSSGKTVGSASQKTDESYHGFTHPRRFDADHRAKIWAQEFGADAATEKAYSNMVFDDYIAGDKQFADWAKGKQPKSLPQAESNRISLRRIINAINRHRTPSDDKTVKLVQQQRKFM